MLSSYTSAGYAMPLYTGLRTSQCFKKLVTCGLVCLIWFWPRTCNAHAHANGQPEINLPT